jgi:sugar lactone lactonase YvrE
MPSLVEPDGTYCQVAGDIEFPNGMVVTPDRSTLVVAESFAGRLSAFAIDDDGALTSRRVWAESWAQTASASTPSRRSGLTRAAV